MTYSYNFVLRKTGYLEYTILSDKGHIIHILNNCGTEYEAMDRAKAWTSSWTSSTIRIENDKSS